MWLPKMFGNVTSAWTAAQPVIATAAAIPRTRDANLIDVLLVRLDARPNQVGNARGALLAQYAGPERSGEAAGGPE